MTHNSLPILVRIAHIGGVSTNDSCWRRRSVGFFCAYVVVLLLASAALAQSAPRLQNSHTSESLRGVSAVSRQVAWASGTHGTYLRTAGAGRNWLAAHVPGAESLDFRAVVAFSASEAFLMSAGPGDQSRIYHTADAGKHWSLQFTNNNPKAFFDSMAFWDHKHGIVLGDPIPDETGKLKFELLLTGDARTWHAMPPAQLPPALDGEGAFAASNSCLAILDSHIWFATGGRAARVFHSSDRGRTWQVFETPIVRGTASAGIFSIVFRDAAHGVIAGGDYQHSDQDGPNLAFTSDGGQSWTLAPFHPQAYFSAAAFDLKNPDRLLIITPESIAALSPANLGVTATGKTDYPGFIRFPGFKLNALSPYPTGGALFVGPNGAIVTIP